MSIFHCQILYGGYETLKAGDYETPDVKFEIPTNRRDRYFQRYSERCTDHAERVIYRSFTKECSFHYTTAYHPSGDPTPSREDMLLTERIRQAGELIGIELLDHIVMGDNCYISFSEQELLRVKGQ